MQPKFQKSAAASTVTNSGETCRLRTIKPVIHLMNMIQPRVGGPVSESSIMWSTEGSIAFIHCLQIAEIRSDCTGHQWGPKVFVLGITAKTGVRCLAFFLPSQSWLSL
uniref:Uncharacterized protein n=1 Tax=Oryza brachyantha TaxID=4533 RepID=J3LUK5_ORYBR